MTNVNYYPYLLSAVSRDNVLPLTSQCNLGCLFCSNQQNPHQVTTFSIPPLSLDMVGELIPFLDSRRKVIIGESATKFDEGEPLTHPDVLTILKYIRQQLPDTDLAITTNGTLLTDEVAVMLAAMQPLEVTISLNSVTRRELLLRDKEPKRALDAVRFLCQYNIPFHGSLVAMPHLTGWSDMDETVDFLASCGARTIRVFLPGYTRLAVDNLRFPLSLWENVQAWAKEKSQELHLPVIPEPALCQDTIPEVYGVIRDTPAAAAGLRSGDIIRMVDNTPVTSRVDAYHQSKRAANPELIIARNHQEMKLTLHKKSRVSPGFVVHYDFDPQRLDDIAVEISRHHAENPLLLVSEFAYPMLLQAAVTFRLSPASVLPVPNRFFGGSIKAAGLLTIDDFLETAKGDTTAHPCDLILLPREALDLKGLDLTGKSIDTLATTLSIPVRAV